MVEPTKADRKLKLGEDEMLRVCGHCHGALTVALAQKAQKLKVEGKQVRCGVHLCGVRLRAYPPPSLSKLDLREPP